MTSIAAPPTTDFAPFRADPVARTRVLVVDDHAAVRTGLRELLGDQADFEVVAAVATAEAESRSPSASRSTSR